MKHLNLVMWSAALMMMAAPSLAQQSDGAEGYNRVRGELSPDAVAPSRESMMNAIQAGTPEQLFTALEYGERVECHECVPLLERLLITSSNSRVREGAAWWLRRRIFGFDSVFHNIRTVLATDPNAVNRAHAAQALGEFMEPNGVQYLAAALTDTDAGVRNAVVRGLGRINSPAGNQAIATALADSDATVRDAALQQVLIVNFFQDHDALLARLADETPAVRRRASLVIGHVGVSSAVPALIGLLTGDSDPMVRQAAAFALGRIGGSDARTALAQRQAPGVESNSLVRDAIAVAVRGH